MSYAKKETVNIVSDKKIIQLVRITGEPPTRIWNWKQFRQCRWRSTKVISIKKGWLHLHDNNPTISVSYALMQNFQEAIRGTRLKSLLTSTPFLLKFRSANKVSSNNLNRTYKNTQSSLFFILSNDIFLKNCQSCRFWILATLHIFSKQNLTIWTSTLESFYDNGVIIKGKILKVIPGIIDTDKLIKGTIVNYHIKIISRKFIILNSTNSWGIRAFL